MRKAFLIFIIPLLSGNLFCQLKNGYEIDITINGLRDSSVFIAYHYGDKQYINDTIALDKAGHGRLSGKELLPQGIYMVVLPEQKYFEFLVSTDQIFSLSADRKDSFHTLSFTGSAENTAFIDYQRKWVSLQQQASSIGKRMQTNKENSDSVKLLSSLQSSQEQKMKAYLKSVMSDNNGTLLAALVKAMLPVEVPEFNIPSGSKNPDSVKWIRRYLYNKDHFFDNIDLNDERLLRTPVLYGRVSDFFTNAVIQSPDSINKEIDRVMQKCRSSYKIFQFLSVYLFNHFRESEIMGHDAVMVKLADDIYLTGKADWVSKEFKDDLRKQIDLIRPNLIGKRAQNLIMDSYKGIFVALDDVEKEFTVLYFWEPDCGHCKESTPKLKAYYDQAKDYSLEVFAVCTTSDKSKWSKYIEDNKLKWINGWDPERRSHFDRFYNVQSTPMVYILDRNKKIIAKKLAVENVGQFIDNYRKFVNQP